MDYVGIDVTTLVQDMVDDPMGSFGFQLALANETLYRRMNFASSDHANSDLHPTLHVCYTPMFVSVEEHGQEFSFRLIPNPAQNIVTVNIEHSMAVDAQLRVLDYSGKLIELIEKPKATTRLDISNWPAGVYFITLNDSKNSRTEKLIVY